MSDLEIREIHLLRGPNIWSNRPVLEAWVDSGSLKDLASRTVPGFLERLKAWLPGLAGHGCTWSGGFPQQLESGACPAHILEHVTLELQTLAGHPLDADKACETRGEDRSKVLVGFHDEVVVRECLCGAREILLAACVGDAFDVAAEITRLQHVVDRHALGPSTNAIVAAAKARAA